MDYKIVSSKKFEKEYADVLNYIINEIKSISAAQNLHKKYKEILESLKTIPKAFSRINIGEAHYRFINCKNYIIVYSVHENRVNLLRFFYAKSDIKNRLKNN